MIHGKHKIEAILFPKHDLNRAKSMQCEYQTGYSVNIHLSKPWSENRSLYLHALHNKENLKHKRVSNKCH